METSNRIQSAQIRYATRLSLGQYEHEELEVSLVSEANPTDAELKELMRKAKKLCSINSHKAEIGAPTVREQVAKSLATAPRSVVAAPAQAGTSLPAFKPDPAFTARPAVAPQTHPFEGFYYGYKIPYKGKAPGVEETLASIRAQKICKWDAAAKLWWTSQPIQGWDSMLAFNAMANAQAPQQAAPVAQQPLALDSIAPAVTYDTDDIPF